MSHAAASDLALVLDRIVRRHGPGVLDGRARLFALLRDHAPDQLRDVRMLMTAHDCGAAARLRALPGPAPEAVLAGEAARVAEEYGCDPILSRKAVETWARLAASLLGGNAAASVQPLPGIRPLPLPSGPARPGSGVGPAASGIGGAIAALASRLGLSKPR